MPICRPHSPRHSYPVRLEPIEDRFLPGDALGWTSLLNLDLFPKQGLAAADTPALSQVRQVDAAVSAEHAPAADTPSRDAASPVLVDPVFAAGRAPVREDDAWLHLPGSAGPGQGTGSIRGIVYGACQTPLPGIEILLGDVSDTRTEPDGTYFFADISAGTYDAGFFVENFGELRAPVEVRAGELTFLNVSLPLVDAVGVFHVTFQPGTPRQDIDSLHDFYGVTILETRLFGDRYFETLRVPDRTFADDFVGAYNQEPIVEASYRIYFETWCLPPEDPRQ